MGEHRYEIPEEPQESGWEQMSEAAREAFEGVGTLVFPGLLPEPTPGTTYDVIKHQVTAALDSWRRYKYILDVPATIDQIHFNADTFETDLVQMAHYKDVLTATGQENPEGINIGDTMEVVLIPWGAFERNLSRIPGLIKDLRREQGRFAEDDMLSLYLQYAIRAGEPMYRDNDTFVSVANYLNAKILIDGEWGTMLMQTSTEPGLESSLQQPAESQTPSALREGHGGRYHIDNMKVDAMGIFEWLALTLQNSALQGSKHASWLLANEVYVENPGATGGGPAIHHFTPCANIHSDTQVITESVASFYELSGNSSTGLPMRPLPRLAVW